MPRSRCQLRVRDPQPLLLLPLLARPHRHPPILQTKPVDTSTLSAHESELAPRAVSRSRKKEVSMNAVVLIHANPGFHEKAKALLKNLTVKDAKVWEVCHVDRKSTRLN